MLNAIASRLDAYTRISPEAKAELGLLRPTRSIRAKRDLIREGDTPSFVYLIVDGWAARYKSLPDGRRQMVGLLVPGDFGDLNVYLLKEMDHTISAITHLDVAELRSEEIERLSSAHPSVRLALGRDGLINVSLQREWTLNIGLRTAFERIGHLLAEIFLRLKTVGLSQGASCDFPLTQNEIADATGLTPVHVNRTLQELRRSGLIELSKKRLTIPDWDALIEASLFNPKYLHLDREEYNSTLTRT